MSRRGRRRTTVIALLLPFAPAIVWADELKVHVSATILARHACHVAATQSAASPLVMHCTGSDVPVVYRAGSGADPATSMSAPDSVSRDKAPMMETGRRTVITIEF